MIYEVDGFLLNTWSRCTSPSCGAMLEFAILANAIKNVILTAQCHVISGAAMRINLFPFTIVCVALDCKIGAGIYVDLCITRKNEISHA